MVTARYRNVIAPLFGAALALTLIVAGCDSLGFFPGDAEPAGEGTLSLLLTDAPFPFDLVASADVTIDSVAVQSEDSARITVISEPQAFNLLDLRNGVTAPLGEQVLPAGTYSQIRLYVSNPSVTLTSGETFKLKVPSGAQSGIKVQLDGLTIEDGVETTLTLDFNLENSFVVQGNPNGPGGIQGFIFKPVVHPIRVTTDAPETDDGASSDEGGEPSGDEGDGDATTDTTSVQ